MVDIKLLPVSPDLDTLPNIATPSLPALEDMHCLG